jgi:hypothetical protein
MQLPSKAGRAGLTAFLAAAVVLSARAAEPDKYLPSDSEAVVVINVQEMLNSPLVKKNLEHLKAAMASNEDAKKFFKATGLDPLKDIHKVVIGASMGGGEPKALIVVRGKFDVDKIQAAVADEAKAKGEDLQVIDKDGKKIYKLASKGGKPTFAAFADNSTLVMSQSEKDTEAGLKGGGGKVSPELVTALDRLGGKESVYAALVITDQMKKMIADGPNPQFKELAPKLQFVTGIFDVTNDVKLKLSVQTSDAKAADKVKMTLNQFVPLIGMMAAGQAEKLGPAVTDLVKQIEVKKDDKNAVSVSLVVTEKMMKDMEENAKNAGKGDKDNKQ